MSKADILNTIRRGLGRGLPSDAERQQVLARITRHERNLIPMRGQGSESEVQALFIEMAKEAAAEVIELPSLQALPGAVREWLQTANIPDLVMASDEELKSLDWTELHPIVQHERVALAGDLASLTLAFMGIAETGTLMLYSRKESPTTLNFLPDNHLVVLKRQDIVGVYEEAWARVRALSPGQLPRTVNMITGPSRSADIEQRLQMGAHGPRALTIFLIG
ncbi:MULTISPECIES: LutC/YkgG family protein [Nitrincola]|uniref:LUD domain-containing protein n=1 Tax=Nitrincola nitratireducens TaxID=1229521 RepID=W9UU14_9GAMM|nr:MULTISPECIES: LUD domain-containing protein [Nitrincola]EXJ10723.1 hypothetical protein D791_02328 [Nitrincola nitratireducens]